MSSDPVAALKGFFRRHELALPPETPLSATLPVLARHGLVFHLAYKLIASDYASRLHTNGDLSIGLERFSQAEWRYGLGVAARLAEVIEDVVAGRADHNGAGVDRIAFLMRRLAAAGLPVDAHALAREGVPAHLILESGGEAAALASAIAAALRAWAARRTGAASGALGEAA